jgi:hypothetical protein
VNAAHTHPWFLAGLGLSVASLGLLACSDQPKPGCVTSNVPFAVKLIEKSREGACDDFGPDSFNADPTIGVAPFYERDDKGQPDYAKGSVGIQTTELGTLLEHAEAYGFENTADDAQLYSQGDFTVSEPNADNLCPAPELSTTHLVLPELPAVEDDPETEDVDESFPGQPAVDITLEWSNVFVVVTPAIFGTQLQADLTDTRVTPDGDSCTIEYRAVGLSPAVPCQASDEEGNPLTHDDGSPQLDETLCDPEPDPSKERFSGSGLSPLARFVCDPVIAYCVVDGDEVPALK